MEEERCVPFDKFMPTVAAELALLQQLTSLVGALAQVLQEKGIVTPDLLNRNFDHAQASAQAKVVRDAIEKLQGYGPLADILKNFEWLLQ